MVPHCWCPDEEALFPAGVVFVASSVVGSVGGSPRPCKSAPAAVNCLGNNSEDHQCTAKILDACLITFFTTWQVHKDASILASQALTERFRWLWSQLGSQRPVRC